MTGDRLAPRPTRAGSTPRRLRRGPGWAELVDVAGELLVRGETRTRLQVSFSDEALAWLRTFPAETSRDDEIRCLPLAEDDHIKLLDYARREETSSAWPYNSPSCAAR